MKRLSLLGFIGIISSFVLGLGGCPIYDGDAPPLPSQCTGNNCGGTDRCVTAADCAFNETCGSDNQCHSGDCSVWGCPSGLSCLPNPDLTVTCQVDHGNTSSSSGSSGTTSSSSSSGSSGTTSSSSSSSGNPITVYCGNPKDCGTSETCAPNGTCQPGTCDVIGCIYGFACTAGSCTRENPAGCGSDDDCAGLGTGYACVSGLCTAPSDQCTDQTQCPAGSKCATGKCTPSCTTSADCTDGFSCDTTRGVCSYAVLSCGITNDCASPDKVCVAGTCVPRSQMGSCPGGDVWVDNGCIPDQAATFVCANDGQQDVCAGGSVCLHHNCYISCAAPNTMACDGLPSFNVCKTVTTTSGDHQVCGSDNNLGSDCDPTAGKACSPGKICIDGYCL